MLGWELKRETDCKMKVTRQTLSLYRALSSFYFVTMLHSFTHSAFVTVIHSGPFALQGCTRSACVKPALLVPKKQQMYAQICKLPVDRNFFMYPANTQELV